MFYISLVVVVKIIDRLIFIINGTVWVDRKDKSDRKKSSIRMIELLNKGYNIMMCPEATWNLEPSLPILPLHWGIIDLSRKSMRPIVPVVLEYVENSCYVRFGEPMYIRKTDNKKIMIDNLRDTLATLKWQIWEQIPSVSRMDIQDDEWENEVKRRLAEYHEYDYDYEQSCILRK